MTRWQAIRHAISPRPPQMRDWDDALKVAVDAAVANFCGASIGANPYAASPGAYEIWRHAWTEADYLLKVRAESTASEWLNAS